MITISTKVDDELRAKLQEIAEREERTVSQVIRMALKAYIENYNKGE